MPKYQNVRHYTKRRHKPSVKCTNTQCSQCNYNLAKLSQKSLIMDILPVIFLLLLTLHFKITDIQGYGYFVGLCEAVSNYMCFATAEYGYYIHFYIWWLLHGAISKTGYCYDGPFSLWISSHIYFVSCIKYLYDWKINIYLSIHCCII